MQRVRQFSAERNQLSKSRLNQSRISALQSNINKNRVQNYQIATTGSNKRYLNSSKNNLSGSRASHKSSNSEYICTGCFNHQIASDRKQERRNQLLREKQIEKLNTQIKNQQDNQKHLQQSRLVRQFTQIRDYNKKVIDEKERQRQKQTEENNRLIEQQKAETEAYFRKQKEKQLQRQRIKQALLRQIRQQIEFKNQKSQKQRQQKLKKHVDDVFGVSEQLYYQQKALKEQQYRQELKRQIWQRDEQLKKEHAEKNNLQNIGIGITEAAYQRQVEREKQVNDRQQALLQEAKYQKKVKQALLEQQKRKQKALEQQRIQEQQQKQKAEKGYYEAKQKQVHVYLSELQQQIEQQKQQRQKQSLHYGTKTSIELDQKPIDSKNCKNCDKKFPKTYLTKLK